MVYALRVELEDRPLLANSRSLKDYLMTTMAGETSESVRVLYLTVHNHLIRDEILSTGTLDHAPIYAREIIHRALELGAANLILAHNHPSGDEAPSRSDVRLTNNLIEVAGALSICVLDHLVVGRNAVSSMRRAGLLGAVQGQA